MTWVRLDDGFPDHPKFIGIGDAALALWVRALAHCNRYLTDGLVVPKALARLSLAKKPSAVADELVAAKLWTVTDDGYLFHDYADYQHTKAQTTERRMSKQEAGRAGGQRSGEARRAKQNEAECFAPACVLVEPKRTPVPIPSRPDPDQIPHGVASAVAPQGRKSGKVRREPEAEPSGYAAVVACYFEAFEAARGCKPPFQARDGKAAKALLLAFGGSATLACDAIRAAYAPGAWTRDKATLASIAADPAKCLGQGSLGASRSTLQHAVAGEAPGWVSAPELVFERGDA